MPVTVVPDLMVLPTGAFVEPPDHEVGKRLKSYRQDKTGGPSPVVVVEVPSDTDSHSSLMTKAHRCRHLGAIVYIVMVDPPLIAELERRLGETESGPG